MRNGLQTVRLTAIVIAAIFSGAPHSRAALNLMNLGSGTFAVDGAATTAPYSQSLTSLNFNGSYSLGSSTLGGTFADQDWSLESAFALRMTLKSGPNPLAPFTVELFSELGVINAYQGNTEGLLLDEPGLILLTLSLPGSGDLSQVTGMQITWDADTSIDVSVSEVASVRSYFTASAPGGVRFINSAYVLTADPGAPASGYWPATATLPPGGTSWSASSDSNAKTGVTAIDHREVLRGLTALPVTSWNYKHDPNRRYVGPMAQDFHRIFGLGFDDKHISTLDADGVALSALKGLIEELRERRERSAEQARRLAELEAELRALSEQIRSNLPPAK